MKKAAGKINTFNVSDFAAQVKTVGGSEANRCKYPARLDTYGCGCAHNCAYCYARSLLEFRGLWNPRYPKVTDYDKVKRIIAKTKTGSVLRLGGMTDCFQPIEERSRATWKAIKWLNQKGIHYLIVTKSDLVASPLYTDLMDKDLAHIQVSITSTDPAKSRAIENAPLPERRIAAAERLQELGFDTAVRLSPFIPDMYDFDVINRIQCDKVLVEFLRVNAWIRKWLGGDFPAHTHTEGGYDHLPLERKKYYLSKITGYGRGNSLRLLEKQCKPQPGRLLQPNAENVRIWKSQIARKKHTGTQYAGGKSAPTLSHNTTVVATPTGIFAGKSCNAST